MQKIRKVSVLTRDGSHRDNFGKSLETLSAVKSQSWPSLRISLAHKTPYCNTKMLLKVVFDKTTFVKFKIM